MSEGSEGGLLLEVLARHGLSTGVSRRLEEVGLELRALQAAHGVEFAAMLDAGTGDSLAPYIRGDRTSVVTERHLRATQPGHRYVQVHSHPSGATFSIDDVAVLFDYFPTVEATVVVAATGWWYVMTVRPGEYPSPISKVYRAYDRAWRRLEPSFLAEVDAGRMTESEAGLALHREIWRTIAGELRFQYDQVRTA